MTKFARVFLIACAAVSLAFAFFTPIATYKALDASAVEQFIGGQQGLEAIAEELTFQLDRHITENHQDFANQVVEAAGDELCVLGLCTWITTNSQEFANSVSERVIMPSSTTARTYIAENYADIVREYRNYTSDIPLLAEQRSNVFAVARSLYDSQTWLLFIAVVLFAITTPVLKLLIALLNVFAAPQGLWGLLWTLVGKLSMVEVFALASIVTAYSNLPLVQITPGWSAVAGYGVFTILILALDLVTVRAGHRP